MKKLITVLLCGLLTGLAVFGLSACGGEKRIVVISRESGSGTRSGFEEALGLKESEVKATSIQNSTNSVMTAVGKNKRAIGYISYGSLNDTVKALKLDGVSCTAETVLSGSYAMQRPFLLVYDSARTLSALEADFAAFLLSAEAQKIVADNKYVSGASDAPGYVSPGGLSGTIRVVGSTSVGPLVDKLFAFYESKNPGVKLEKTENGSGAGITAAGKEAVFGMSSRALKAEEAASLTAINVCIDAIAVIVNNDNAIADITRENLAKIYRGEIVTFADVK